MSHTIFLLFFSLSAGTHFLFFSTLESLWTPPSSFLVLAMTSLFFTASLSLSSLRISSSSLQHLYSSQKTSFCSSSVSHSYSLPKLPPSFSGDSCFLEPWLNFFLAPHLSFWPQEQKDEDDFFFKIVQLVKLVQLINKSLSKSNIIKNILFMYLIHADEKD